MKNFFKPALFLLLIILLAAWIAQSHPQSTLPGWAADSIHHARQEFQKQPLFVISLFCALHIFSAMFSIPGSCTTLNIASGAVFGFWLGCAIVYPITVLSGCLGYFLASKSRNLGMLKKYETSISALGKTLESGGFLALIALRLSPFLPYGILNPALGALGVPFPAFLLSTGIGIFFDVTLLNSLGAALADSGAKHPSQNWYLMAVFVTLLVATLLVRVVRKKGS